MHITTVPMFELSASCFDPDRAPHRRGSWIFDLPEAMFAQEAGFSDIVASERTWRNRHHRNFLLLANETVAGHL